jgi:preprotein translocase subunit SecF
MFTAISITRILLQGVAHTKIAENPKWLGVGKEKKVLSFDFIGKSKLWFTSSAVVFILALSAIFTFGLNLGIDFKGGSLLALKFKETTTKEQITKALDDANKEIANAPATPATVTESLPPSTIDDKIIKTPEEEKFNLSSINVITSSENEFIIKTNYLTPGNHDLLLATLKNKVPAFDETRFTTIGPTIGATLLSKAIIAGFVSIIMIVIYLYFAFRKIPKEVNPWRFGASAIVTLIHDVVIIMGIFAVLGKFLGVEIDALFATAMLTLFGYSVNDRIVIFDRLRETLTHSSLDNVKEIANKALNETLARSINTSVSIALTMLAILIFGHESIFYFVLALMLGVIIASYTSIFLAAPLIVYWSDKKIEK